MVFEDILNLIEHIGENKELQQKVLELLIKILDLRKNKFHPLVFISGKPKIGQNVFIGFLSEVNAKNAEISIGDDCDISSFVAINAADSHKKCLGLSDDIERGKIILENNVFVGSHSFIGSNVHIGHNSVVAAGTIVRNSGYIPPFSLIIGNPAKIKEGYYLKKE